MPDISQLEEKLKFLRQEEEEKDTQRLAEKFNLPYLNLFLTSIDPEAVALLSENQARAAQLIIFRKRGKSLWVALRNPDYPPTKQIIQTLKEKGYKLKLYLVSLRSLRKAWQTYQTIPSKKPEITGQIVLSFEEKEKIKNLDDFQNELKKYNPYQSFEILKICLITALQTNASDLHLELTEENLKIRYRLDGVLQNAGSLPLAFHSPLLERIKLLSGMKLNIRDNPQDGRFTIIINNHEKKEIEARVSVIPSTYGENVVIRILNPIMLLDLKSLGLRPHHLKILEEEITKPNGMLIITGPTGSGKTTTLYACLKRINKPGIKIVTLEDPIEYRLEGINQSQVDPSRGYTFAKGLRALFRHDPDVMLIGEIRDQETAEIATQAALTGHLLFTTLHTNDAAGVVPRLLELGVKADVLAAALNLFMAQRLVRRLCPYCREPVLLNKTTINKIKESLANLDLPEDIFKKTIYKAKGCPQCNRTGYQGRIGVFELIPVDKEIEKFIATGPNHAQITELIFQRKIMTMYQDGLLKVLEGITTLEEVKRVLKK